MNYSMLPKALNSWYRSLVFHSLGKVTYRTLSRFGCTEKTTKCYNDIREYE